MTTPSCDVHARFELLSRRSLLVFALALGAAAPSHPALGPPSGAAPPPPNVELRNGLWFDGAGFEPKTVYSVAGVFATRRPERIDRTLDLDGAFVVPPFAEAHAHDIGLGAEERDRQAIAAYLAAGVFYV